jgi:hypothetical protein
MLKQVACPEVNIDRYFCVDDSLQRRLTLWNKSYVYRNTLEKFDKIYEWFQWGFLFTGLRMFDPLHTCAWARGGKRGGSWEETSQKVLWLAESFQQLNDVLI